MKQRIQAFCTLVFAAGLMVACGGAEPGRSSAPTCEPGEEVACSCGDDEEGSAECDDEGEAGECSCSDSASGDERDSGKSEPQPDADSDQAPMNGARRDGGTTSASKDAATPQARDAGSSDASTPATGDAGAQAGSDASGPANPPGSANPAMNGPFAPMTEMNVGPGMAFTLVRPRELGMGGVKHPVITWGNGTGATPRSYTGLLNRLASHGFVVIASNSTNTGSGNEMLQGVDWVLEQNMTSGSPMFEKIDTSQIGATGHSQGGFGTCQAARDARIKTIAPIQGFRSPRGFGGSIFAISGGMDTIVMPTGISSGFDSLTKGPAMYGELKSATHTDWIGGRNASGSAYFEAVTAWMRVHLMADEALRSKFYGAQCGYCMDAAWTIKQKGME